MNWTEEEYQDYLRRRGIEPPKPEKKKRPKYGNKIVYIDGNMFRSMKEAARYGELKLLKLAGEILGFILQPKFILEEGSEKQQPITYSADFLVIYPGMICEVEDTKGYESEQWNRTYKLFKKRYPGIELKVIK
ncbi:MAG TPA: DUF1064 domain-containing protein [Clostridia bacterium]|nr:DUF1064 domain-containing protein [Clostridia bacterium]